MKKSIIKTLSIFVMILSIMISLTACVNDTKNNDQPDNNQSEINQTDNNQSDNNQSDNNQSDNNQSDNKILKDINTFYETVKASQESLDKVADDIYKNWYNAIYNNKFYGSIDLAILSALSDNEETIKTINTNETEISNLYKKIRDSQLSAEIKEVMTAYSDYYEFVINVSGSFQSFSASKETLKKELASALKSLYLEL